MLNLTSESSDCMLVSLVNVSDEVLVTPRHSGQCTTATSAPTTDRLYRVWWQCAIQTYLPKPSRSL